MNEKRENGTQDLRGLASIVDLDAYILGILATVAEAIISIDTNQRIILFNTGAERVFGYTENEVLGESIELLIPPVFRVRHAGHVHAFANGTDTSRQMDERLDIAGYRKNGETFPAEASITKAEVDGQLVFTVILRDITERIKVEAALRQAEKMEAVVQLTGGVAHDFNNMLAVILGNVELLNIQFGENQLLSTIDRAAARGAELTQRLLSFARHQILVPRTIDLAEVIPGFSDLFQGALGDSVRVSTDIPQGLWPITADQGQLESALLNLANNSRDAMPNGGSIEIECSNMKLREGGLRLGMQMGGEIAKGDYVQISFRDTGNGMPKVVLEQAFEPFFTTKDVGEGSGLGLSMVYGFARQSDGGAVIESTPGMGTEVRLLLPRTTENAVS